MKRRRFSFLEDMTKPEGAELMKGCFWVVLVVVIVVVLTILGVDVEGTERFVVDGG